MRWFHHERLSEQDPKGAWQRNLAEQRAEDRAMSEEVNKILDSLPQDEHVPAAVRSVFELFQQWYFTFADRSAGRLALINANIRRQIRVIAVSLTAIAVILIGIGVLSIKFTIDQSNEPKKFADSVQASRFDATYSACQESNARHNRSVAFLASVAKAQLGDNPTPAQRAAEAHSLGQFDTLINDLAPKRKDCRKYALKQTRLPGANPTQTTRADHPPLPPKQHTSP